MFLVSRCLVQYRIRSKSHLRHRESRSISLLDAYVCSGYLAALALPNDEYNAKASAAARRYQDGLEVDDSDEDTLFVILYQPNAVSPAGTKKRRRRRKLVVFRTRSKLERDAWCWAINCEIEKLLRNMKVGE
jgi:hypothetical protein